MYENTGNKIKGFAKFCAFCDIFVCIIVGIFLFACSSVTDGDRSAWFCFGGFAFLIPGIVISWLKYLFLASYGELVEETTKSSGYLKEIKDVLTSTHIQEKNIPNKAVEVQKTGCSYCGSKSELMFGNLCPDCTNLLNAGIIYKCPDCNTYNYKTNICKCKHR